MRVCVLQGGNSFDTRRSSGAFVSFNGGGEEQRKIGTRPLAAALDAECDPDRLGLASSDSLQVEFNEEWRRGAAALRGVKVATLRSREP